MATVRLRQRRPSQSAAYATVRAILHEPWQVDPADLEGIAGHAHERAMLASPVLRLSGFLLASHHRYLIVPCQRAECGIEGLFRDVLHVRPSADDARWNLRVLHELAHALLRRHHPYHGHADVWALTLALAIPRAAFRRRAEAHHVPKWAVALRGLTARAVSHAA